jgi:tetrahydromethanopterin S-methyltransferase subunit E
MRSARGLFASSAFLLALPLTALYGMVLGNGVEAVIHGALALGAALMAFAVFDFNTPRWMTWIGSVSAGLLACIFFLQDVQSRSG